MSSPIDRASRKQYDRALSPTTLRLKGVVAYDGTDYMGWQTQPSGKGVQDVLEGRLSHLLGGRVYVAGSGRTDRGVHARAQVFHFELPTDLSIRAPHLAAALATSNEEFAACLERLICGLASGLPSSVQVTRIDVAPAGFHARDSCVGKRYVYTVHEGAGSPSTCRTRWVLGRAKRLDVDAMQAAADLLVGSHDFSAFGVRLPTDPRDPNKVMRRLEVRRHVDDDVVRAAARGAAEGADAAAESVVTICAECDRFLYNMMRMISGSLVHVGLGRLRVEEISELLAAKERTAEPKVVKAPAHGLCLEQCFMIDDGPHPPWVATTGTGTLADAAPADPQTDTSVLEPPSSAAVVQ